ncbi:MAG: hypothetical protein PHQ09_01310 [Actinomycetota bacterium]|nr:hypothetical protein [Actinomycetota bacterium]
MKKIIIILFVVILIILSLLVIIREKNLCDARNEIDSLKSALSDLEVKIVEKDEKLKNNNILINNSNILLSTVYYGTAEQIGEGPGKNFTAFSLFYKDKFYLITAGHCIEYEDLKYTNFKFKQNNSESFIYPILLDYNNDYRNNRDYAIFRSYFIRNGLLIYNEDKEPKYVLGNTEKKINFFKEFNTATEGESGSPILNSKCRLVGIVIKNNSQYTPIDTLTEAIDRIIKTTGES